MDAEALLVICCDAGNAIGLGHLSRCSALANAWNNGARRSLLLASRAETLQFASRFGDVFHEAVFLDVPANDGRAARGARGRSIRDFVERRDAALVVFDDYTLTSEDQAEVACAGRALLAIDDMAQLPFYSADFVLNPNAGAERLAYPSGPLTRRLLGWEHLLLRPEFLRCNLAAKKDPGEGLDVVVVFGGSDPTNLTTRVLDALSAEKPRLTLHVVVGPANAHRAAIEQAASQWGDRCRLLVGATSLAETFRRADLAISAGGGTIWELAACGAPTIGVVAAENQRRGVAAFAAAGAIVSLDAADKSFDSKLREAVETLVEDEAARAALGSTAQSLVDGRDAKSVVSTISDSLVILRRAARDDAERLLEWTNDPAVRAASFKSLPIALDEHLAWLDRQLADPRTRIWLAEDALGRALGAVRFNPAGPPCVSGDGWAKPSAASAVISVSVAPELRGRGIGPRMIRLATLRYLHEMKCQRVVAYIKPANLSSQRAFVRAGYSFTLESSCQSQPAWIYTFDRNDVADLQRLAAESVS